MKAQIILEGADELKATLRAAEKGLTASRKPVLQRIADRFVDSIKKRVQAGLSPGLTETTIALRGGGSTPLIGGQPLGKHSTGVGTILGNIRAQAGDNEAAAVADDYRARFHQFGFLTSDKSAIPGKQVPARPFILINKADEEWALNEVADYLFEDRRAS